MSALWPLLHRSGRRWCNRPMKLAVDGLTGDEVRGRQTVSPGWGQSGGLNRLPAIGLQSRQLRSHLALGPGWSAWLTIAAPDHGLPAPQARVSLNPANPALAMTGSTNVLWHRLAWLRIAVPRATTNDRPARSSSSLSWSWPRGAGRRSAGVSDTWLGRTGCGLGRGWLRRRRSAPHDEPRRPMRAPRSPIWRRLPTRPWGWP